MITLTDAGKSFGAHTLFEGANLQLNPSSRYGLVGANGSGKTTLLRILSGADELSTGSVSKPKRVRIGTLDQDQFRFEKVSILDVVMMGHRELWRAMRAKERLFEDGNGDFDGERYAELEDVILSHDGYAFEARSGEILEGLGIPTPLHRRPLETLSGGFKLRVLLAQVLASDPEVVLLDEPTNHLDILSIRWLEKFLSTFTGCAVIISHDHRFLDNVCTHILDIDYETITAYTGNYTAFQRAKTAERQRREAEIAKREKKIAEHQAFVDRFRAKATKARQAQSRLKMIDRTVIEPLPPSSRRYPSFRFRQRRPSGKQVIELDGICKTFTDRPVLEAVSLHVRRGDRIAVIGPNGIGKSTLLKIVTGRLAADCGRAVLGHEVQIGYFAQDHRDELGDSDATVESWLSQACPGEGVGTVRSRLGRVLFERDEVSKRVSALSGGEAARLVFARLEVDQPNLLVLDEPTNHLDLEAIEALVSALSSYDGTLLFVSHDRWFVARLATRVLELTERGYTDFRGGYDDYVASCGDDHLDTEAVILRQRASRRKRNGRDAAAGESVADGDARRRRERERERDTVTAAIAEAEARIAEINARFCAPGFFESTPQQRVVELQREQQALSSEVARLMAAWEELERQLEAGD